MEFVVSEGGKGRRWGLSLSTSIRTINGVADPGGRCFARGAERRRERGGRGAGEIGGLFPNKMMGGILGAKGLENAFLALSIYFCDQVHAAFALDNEAGVRLTFTEGSHDELACSTCRFFGASAVGFEFFGGRRGRRGGNIV